MRTLVVLLVAATLGACVAGPEIRISQDPAADFSAFETFGFPATLGTDRAGRPSSLGPRLSAATTRELQDRGMQFVSNNPDVFVNFYSSLQTGLDTANQPIWIMPVQNYGSWAGYNARFRAGDAITEGTLVVHVIDRRSNQLVWEGIAQDRVTQSMRDNLDQTIRELMATIFSNFPR